MPDCNSQPIRVLQVIGAMDLGGAETMIMDLYRKIDKRRIQFDFLVQTTKKCANDDEIEMLGGRVFHIVRFKGYNSVRFYKKCRAFFKEHPEIRIVHGHIGSSAALYLHAANKEGRYTIAHSHSAIGIHNAHDFFYKIFSYPTRYIAKSLFGCSTEAGIARFGRRSVKKKKYRNFHNAIESKDYIYNPKTREIIRNELGLSKDDIVIGTVGRMTEAKNPNMIIHIFREIVNKGGKCLWVGDGELFDVCKRSIEGMKLGTSVILTGRRNDIPKVLQAFDGFILPSFWEGLPVVAIEAQASGLPCLISDTVSKEAKISELIEWKSIRCKANDWAETILSMAKDNISHRNSPLKAIQENGYDIQSTAEWLMNYYIDKSKGLQNG